MKRKEVNFSFVSKLDENSTDSRCRCAGGERNMAGENVRWYLARLYSS